MSASPGDAAGLLNAFAEALNTRDIDSLVSLFTEDADWVDFLGHWQRGRGAVRNGHVNAFAGLLASGTMTLTEVAESAVGVDVLLCHARWSIPAHELPTGQALPDRQGVITIVAIRTEDGLRIRAGQNTEIPAP